MKGLSGYLIFFLLALLIIALTSNHAQKKMLKKYREIPAMYENCNSKGYGAAITDVGGKYVVQCFRKVKL